MPRGGSCNHPACAGDPDGCRMLTNAELAPSEDDLALARRLLAEGWIQSSANHRTLALPPPNCRARDLIRPEVLDTPIGELLKRFIHNSELDWARRHKMMKLTVRQWRAWKQVTGPAWEQTSARWKAGDDATIDPDAAAPPPAPPAR